MAPTKWEMLVPQPVNVVHNLIRNPSFEYNDPYFAGNHQYWWYLDSTATKVSASAAFPSQSTNWSSYGQDSLRLALDGTTFRHAEYTPRFASFDALGETLSVVIDAPDGTPATAFLGTQYPIGTHYACAFLLTPYGGSLASQEYPYNTQSGTAPNQILNNPSGYNMVDLLRGKSKPFFSTGFTTTSGTPGRLRVRVTPSSAIAEYPAVSCGIAVFWSRPGDTHPVTGDRTWRCVGVRPASATANVFDFGLPSTTSAGPNPWERGATVFYTNTSPTFNTYSIMQDNGSTVDAAYIGIDSSQPALALTPTGIPWNLGSTYSHHVYLEWYIDTNYTVSTSPFIACACDYAVTFIDNLTGTVYTPVNPDTGNNRLGATPSDRSKDKRTGRTKLLLAPPNNSVNLDAGLDLRLRISIISPTGSYTGNAAVLYIDALQLIDIRYRGDDELNWDDVEFTYLDGDIAGSEWEDFAPSYTSIAGTAVNGIYPASTWLGTTNAGWASAFSMPNRSVLLNANTVDVNTYGGTTYRGYAQSWMRTFNSEVGVYYPIDTDHLGVSVNVSTTGVGMPDITTVSQQYGVIDGGIIQRQIANMRTFQLSIDIVGNSLADLHDRRRKVINALKFDQLAQQGDRIMRYSGSGSPVLYHVTYTAGLEFTGNVGVSFSEAASIQFLCADPYVYADRSVSTQLTLTGELQDTRTYLAYKQGDNQPWVYTGLKDYADFYQGNGTIVANAASGITAQSSNGTLVSNYTANTTMTTTTGSATVTFGAAFLYGDFKDVGRTIYYRAGGIGNIIVLGVIGAFSSTTVCTLTSAVSVGYVTSAGSWWVSNKYAQNSIGTLSSTFVGQYLCYGTTGNVLYQTMGKIFGVNTNLIEFEQYQIGVQAFGTAPNSASPVPAGSWYTVGYSGNTTISNCTGTGTAFIEPTVGMFVYSSPAYVNPIGTMAGVGSSTAITVDIDVLCPGTISIPASTGGSGVITGVNTRFTSADIGKIIATENRTPIGIIATVTSATSITINTTRSGYPIALPAGSKFRLIRPTQIASTNYWLKSPELNWSGGYFKYHLGFIQSPVSNSVAIIVGGFDNGKAALGYGMDEYLAILTMDGKQNISAGNYSIGTPTSVRGITANATDGLITCSTASATVTTNQSFTFWPSDVGLDLHSGTPITATNYLGTIKSWDSPTQVTLWENATANVSNALAYKRFNETVPNPDYASVRPLLNYAMTRSLVDTTSGITYYSVRPTAPITCIYQESATSVLVAGTFSGWSTSGVSVTDIRIIRIRGWMRRQGTSSTVGAPSATDSNTVDIEVVARTSTANWGVANIFCMTTDPLGNIYVGGDGFTTSHVWYIGRASDGTFATTFTPLGAYTGASVIALVTDTRFPVVNLYAAISTSPWLRTYPFFNPRSSAGIWYDPSSMSVNGSFYTQGPNDIIYSFLRTQAGDILVSGAFDVWGATFVNGLARFVPKIGASSSDNPAVITPAVPTAGSFAQPGVAGTSTSGTYVGTLADVSYNTTNNSYSGTGERIAFGGYFFGFADGRTSLSFGYLEGSGSASSVRRIITSDLGLEIPTTSSNYPVIQKIASTSRGRSYYDNNQVTKTDNLVGPTYAVLMTQANGSSFNSGSPVFRSGFGPYASTNTSGIPQMTNCVVQVRGNANVYPIFTFTLSANTSIFELIQTETGARIRFDDLYGLRGVPAFTGNPEIITLDTRPGYRSVTSNLRGSLMQFVSPESNFGDFYLLAAFTANATIDTYRENTLVVRYSVVNSTTQIKPTIVVSYTPRFWSFDASRLFTDAPDTPLM